MKLKYKFVVRSVAGQSVALAVGDENKNFNGMIKLNSVGEFIFKLLENDIDLDGIIDQITKTYDVTPEKARESVESYLDVLRKNDLLEE